MTQVWDRLFIGEIAEALEVAESNTFGIATVITLYRKPIRIRRAGVNYLSFPVAEAHAMSVGQIDAILDALLKHIRLGRVLVASKDGASRAPIIAAAWIHAVGCKDIDSALADIGKLRNIEPSPVLLRGVKRALK